MLSRPSSCQGCPLDPISTGFMRPVLAANGYGVSLIGEALGEDEAEEGLPFVGRAGFRLTRLIEWAGFERKLFNIFNTVWCMPPDNKLESTPYELPAIRHCRSAHWEPLIQPGGVLVPMGNVAINALIERKGILSIRGYVAPGPNGTYVIPTVHPSYIQRGQSKWSAAFINDLQKAVELARGGYPPQFTDYLLDPSPAAAYKWALDYRAALDRDGDLKLAFDIETPGKDDEEEDLDVGEGTDKTWFIWRIGFSYKGLSALSVPWEPPFFPAIKTLLGSSGQKVVWNAGFDVPRIRRAGIPIHGLIHDGMVAWHILHSDLPKSLKFVATFTCPWQPAWKHLSGSKPAFYNATDADVEWRAMECIESELRKSNLWDVYQRDVLDLDPVLQHMQRVGMPVDLTIRSDRANRLDERLQVTKQEMAASVPPEARRIEHVYATTPKILDGLDSRPGTRDIGVCSTCGVLKPRKDHFKRFVKKSNPCAGGHVELCTVEVTEYYRFADFTPSRDQLIRYHNHLNRPLPMVFDKKEKRKKVSFGERQLKDLTGKYPDDTLYKSILTYRKLDKIAGTYIGRPVDV